LAEPLGIVTKVEKEGEEEEREEGEGEKEERMSYPGDPMLEDESLQYRVQGTFSQHRYALTLFHTPCGWISIHRFRKLLLTLYGL